jgi:glycosyltransferase involved in cell wall biosynthesis
MGRKLKIVGGKQTISNPPPNVELLGQVSNDDLRDLMRGTRALLFPQLEDFGMTPLEVNACGRPVVAYGAGGALDTVVDGRTGVLAPEQSIGAFVSAMGRLEQMTFDSDILREHAKSFSKERFEKEILDFVEFAWERHQKAGTSQYRN